jgi:hypothetical protein
VKALSTILYFIILIEILDRSEQRRVDAYHKTRTIKTVNEDTFEDSYGKSPFFTKEEDRRYDQLFKLLQTNLDLILYPHRPSIKTTIYRDPDDFEPILLNAAVKDMKKKLENTYKNTNDPIHKKLPYFLSI